MTKVDFFTNSQGDKWVSRFLEYLFHHRQNHSRRELRGSERSDKSCYPERVAKGSGGFPSVLKAILPGVRLGWHGSIFRKLCG
jgi:hypothetical protein